MPGIRTRVGLAVEAGDCRDLHHAAVLLGVGAGAVCPWLALQTAAAAAPEKGEENMLKTFDQGLAKIMSKMGISVVDSYRGAHLFDSIGLNDDVIFRCLRGTPAPLGGIGFAEIEAQVRRAWQDTFHPEPPAARRARAVQTCRTTAGCASARPTPLSRMPGSRSASRWCRAASAPCVALSRWPSRRL